MASVRHHQLDTGRTQNRTAAFFFLPSPVFFFFFFFYCYFSWEDLRSPAEFFLNIIKIHTQSHLSASYNNHAFPLLRWRGWVWSSFAQGHVDIDCCGRRVGSNQDQCVSHEYCRGLVSFADNNHLRMICVVPYILQWHTSEETVKAELKINQWLKMSRLQVTMAGSCTVFYLWGYC